MVVIAWPELKPFAGSPHRYVQSRISCKRRDGAGGRLAGGQRFSRGALYLMLQNRIYRGDIVH
jgi:hypothetical protein